MTGRFSYITLAATNTQRTVRFYEDVFGWICVRSISDAHFFELPNLTVVVMSAVELNNFTGTPAAESGSGYALYSWNVADREAVDSLLERAVSAGASIQRETGELQWGGYGGIMCTADGHRWEIVWSPKAP